MTIAPTPGRPVPLQCLGGNGAPPDLVRDALQALTWSADARTNLWPLIAATVRDEPVAEAAKTIDAFCERFALSPDEVARCIRACRFLTREGARRDVPAPAFADDLRALDASGALAAALHGYAEARVVVRREVLERSIAEHGALLTGVDWRLDTVTEARDGVGFQYPLAIVTLRYRVGAQEQRLTLQVLPDQVENLAELVRRLGRRSEGAR